VAWLDVGFWVLKGYGLEMHIIFSSLRNQQQIPEWKTITDYIEHKTTLQP
jgi:hypothetical protein